MALWLLPMHWWLGRGHDAARRRARSGCRARAESGACAVPRCVCGPNADVRMRCDAMTYVRSASWKIRSARPLATISAHPQSATNLRNCNASACGPTSAPTGSKAIVPGTAQPRSRSASWMPPGKWRSTCTHRPWALRACQEVVPPEANGLAHRQASRTDTLAAEDWHAPRSFAAVASPSTTRWHCEEAVLRKRALAPAW